MKRDSSVLPTAVFFLPYRTGEANVTRIQNKSIRCTNTPSQASRLPRQAADSAVPCSVRTHSSSTAIEQYKPRNAVMTSGASWRSKDLSWFRISRLNPACFFE